MELFLDSICILPFAGCFSLLLMYVFSLYVWQNTHLRYLYISFQFLSRSKLFIYFLPFCDFPSLETLLEFQLMRNIIYLFIVIFLHLLKFKLFCSRNDPSVIKKRFLSVLITSALSPFAIYIFSSNEFTSKVCSYDKIVFLSLWLLFWIQLMIIKYSLVFHSSLDVYSFHLHAMGIWGEVLPVFSSCSLRVFIPT